MSLRHKANLNTHSDRVWYSSLKQCLNSVEVLSQFASAPGMRKWKWSAGSGASLLVGGIATSKITEFLVDSIQLFIEGGIHMTWCKLPRRLGFTHKFCIETFFIFKISSSEEKYFQVLSLNTRKRTFNRFALNSYHKN